MQLLTNRELQDLLNNCSSVKEEIRLPDGRKKYIFKHRAILDRQGNPIGLDEYMIQSGERKMLSPTVNKEKKSVEERVAIKNAIRQYKKHGSPKGFSSKLFASKWMQRKIEELVLC